jgi:hypothetical protein
MACSGCKKRREGRNNPITKDGDLMGGYKYLNDRQIKIRLEVYKKRFCRDCNDRYKCDYNMYLKCGIRLIK